MKITRFRSLDGLRGIFSLTVLLNHAIQSVTGWKNDGPFVGPHLSVVYFFMISGFVLSHAHKKDSNFIRYALYRFARLWPLTAIAMFVMVAIFAINKMTGSYYPGDFVFSWKTWVTNLSFMRGMTPHYIELINEPSWSIGIEFWVSLLIPTVFLKINKFIRVAISVAIFSLLAYSASTGVISANLNNMFSLLTAIASMILGSALYTISQMNFVDSNSKSKASGFVCMLAMAICLFGVYSQPFAKDRMDFIYIAAFIPLLFSDYLSEKSLVKRFLYSSPVQFLGYISFPLYLLHFAVMITGITIGKPVDGVLKMTAASILVAYFYTKYIDVKMYSFLKGQIDRFFPSKSAVNARNNEA